MNLTTLENDEFSIFFFVCHSLAKNITFSLPGNRGGGYECIAYVFKQSVLALSELFQITIHILINMTLFASKGQHASYIPMDRDREKSFSRLKQSCSKSHELEFSQRVVLREQL